jgi:two-component system response regulator HydG
MPMETQIKMLRVLEDRKVTRVGSNEEHEVNVRLVAATNADLKAMVEKKTFRGDLYYRLTVVSIHLPPLRDRRSDIPLLMEHFRKDICGRMHKEVLGFTKAARQALITYDWPGNIRQLRNTIERMIVLDSDSQLDVDDLPDDIAALAHRDGEAPGVAGIPGSDSLIGRPLTDVERYYIHRALELTEGKREEAAQLLGIGERTLYRKIKEYGLKNY